MTRRLFGGLALLGALLGTGLLLAGPASAHATVVASDPGDGTRLKSAPKSVTITFDESVGLGNVGYLHVTDQSGRRVDAGAAFHPGGNGSKVTDTLTSGLGDGTYTASFRVVSADSHPLAGTIRFVVGNGALARGSVSSVTGNHATSQTFDYARWVSYAGLAVLGGLWLILTVWPAGRDDRRAGRLVWTGWGLATLGAALELLLQGPYSSGAGPGQLLTPSLIDDTLHSNYGQVHCIRLVLLGALAVLLARALQADARASRAEAAVAGALGVGIVWTFSGAGHSGTTSPAWLSVVLDMSHLTAMATWLGGLLVLVAAVLPRREPAELRAVLPVFSTAAFVSMVVLAGSGTYAAWRGIGTVHAIFTTTYGLLVVGKIVLFLGLITLGNWSRLLVRNRMRPTLAYAITDATLAAAGPDSDPDDDETDEETDDDPVATERLRRSVLVETAVALLVLALTAVLVAQPRGKEALAAQYREPVSATAPLGSGRSVTITSDPGTHGTVNLTLELSPGTEPTKITATATQAAAQVGPIPVRLTRAGKGVYDGSVSLPVAGSWEIDLVVTTSQFDATSTDAILRLH